MEVRLWRRRDALETAVTAADRRHDVRERLFVEIEREGRFGWGEVSPLQKSSDSDPACEEVAEALAGRAFDSLLEIFAREGDLPLWSRAHLLANGSHAEAWAFAAVEMALLDLELVESGRSLCEYWGVDDSSVPEMATTSLIDFDPAWRPPDSASRVRVKTTAGVGVAAYAPVIASWQRDVLLDFNGSAGDGDEVRRQILELAGVPLVAVEQPFAAGDLASHCLLASVSEVPVSLDESVRSIQDARLIARHGAASIICVKPARVGGLASARAILDKCSQWGLTGYVGGFFESELGRRANRAVAAGFPVAPSDVAPVAHDGQAGTLRATGIGVVPAVDSAELLQSLSRR